MLIKEISFPSSLKYIKDIYDYNLDVLVELEDGSEYYVLKILFQYGMSLN